MPYFVSYEFGGKWHNGCVTLRWILFYIVSCCCFFGRMTLDGICPDNLASGSHDFSQLHKSILNSCREILCRCQEMSFYAWQWFIQDNFLYFTGEALVVTVEINNNSSRTVKPKFILYQKHSFFAQGHRTVYTHDILKDKAEAVEASSGRKTVTKVITIPGDLPPSILNSHIINLEYRLKVNNL